MSRYIDINAIRLTGLTQIDSNGDVLVSLSDVRNALAQTPTAEVVEVRHGEWRSELQKRCDWRGKQQQYYCPNACSVCHNAVVDRTPYCPNCGSKMDGERRERSENGKS